MIIAYRTFLLISLELRLMFRLMDRVSDGIAPMLKYLEDHIINAGLADMMVAAELITQVNQNLFSCCVCHIHLNTINS